MNPLMLLLATVLAGGVAAYTYDDIRALYDAAHQQLLETEARRDAQTLQAARIQCQAFHAQDNLSEEALVAYGCLDKSFLDRPKVGPKVDLPDASVDSQ